MNAPGSPSSALQITYFGVVFERRANSHLRPVLNPAPPRPRSPASVTVRITSSFVKPSALPSP